MEQATPEVRELARLLLALEANQSEVNSVLNVLQKLQVHLSKLVGGAGFQALLTRALALAKAEVSWLKAVHVQPDAGLGGFHETAQQQSSEAVTEGSVALLAQLLGLLVNFIGETLTLRLVADVWSDAQLSLRHLSMQEINHE